MSWTTPPTFTTGNTLTAAQMNTNVRDNPNFLHDPPMVLAGRSSAQSIPNNTATAINFTTGDVYDTDSMHSTSTNPSRVVANTAGVYLFWYFMEFAGVNTTGLREAYLMINGTNIITVNAERNPTASFTTLGGQATYLMAATDYIELIVAQTSGAGLNATVASISGESMWLGAQWMGSGV
jgi:hypothetical protein